MSGRRDGSFVRSERLLRIARQIVSTIHKSDVKQCEYAGLLTWIMFDMGLTEKTAREYVDVVVRAKGWRLNDGVITLGEPE